MNPKDDTLETRGAFIGLVTVQADQIASSVQRVAASHAADNLGDEIMAAESPDGRPPSRHDRLLAWRTAAFVGPALAGLLVLWLLIRGTHGHDLLWLCAAFLIVAPLSAWPVLAAGAWRGKEERAAIRAAHADIDATR
jgi:hypothetical protein